VARTVVVAPAKVMLVLTVARRERLEHNVQIVNRSWLELDRRHAGSGPDDEHRDGARPHTGFGHSTSDHTRDVMRISLSFRRNLVRVRRDHR